MGEGEPIRVTTTPEQACEFVIRLMDDDEFRRRYENDTLALFGEYGLELPNSMLPERIVAPSRESLEVLRQQLPGLLPGGDVHPFFFIWLFFFIGGRGPRGSEDFFSAFPPAAE